MSVILTCTDGSAYAHSVYHYSAWAAKQMDAAVHVLHMLDPHHEDPLNADFSGSIGLGARTALMEELVELEATRAKIAQKRGEAILSDAEERLLKAGVSRILTAQKHDRLSDSIETYEKDADLVVLGKRGNHANSAKGHLGSNLERVIRSCHHPVLVASVAQLEMKRFVIAYDGGPSAEKAVDYAVTKPLLKGMECLLIYCAGGHSKVAAKLEAAEEKMRAAGYAVTSETRKGEPEKEIADVAARNDVDLLVMGAYGHSKIRQFFVGSTTTDMIRKVKIPFLLFR